MGCQEVSQKQTHPGAFENVGSILFFFDPPSLINRVANLAPRPSLGNYVLFACVWAVPIQSSSESTRANENRVTQLFIRGIPRKSQPKERKTPDETHTKQTVGAAKKCH